MRRRESCRPRGPGGLRHWTGRLSGRSAPAARALLDVSLGLELRDRLLRAVEHLGRRLSDERTGQGATRPDNVNFLAAFERGVQLTFDAAAQSGLSIW